MNINVHLLMRKILVCSLLGIILSVIIAFFWLQELRYNLPTPLPAKYQVVYTGESIRAPADLKTDPSKPVFLHFFNPDCPCSKFNIKHFKELQKKYESKMDFVIVVISDKIFTSEQIQKRFDTPVAISFDTSIARACGVYSTPQAALIDRNNHLYYRGNYNKSRYCTDKKTNYAELAIEGLLHNNRQLVFSPEALEAYGCELSINKNS